MCECYSVVTQSHLAVACVNTHYNTVSPRLEIVNQQLCTIVQYSTVLRVLLASTDVITNNHPALGTTTAGPTSESQESWL